MDATGSEGREEASTASTNGVDLIKGPGLSPWITKVRKDNPHLGDTFARLNAAGWYNKKVKEDQHRRHQEEQQAERAAADADYLTRVYEMYPWDMFVPTDPTDLNELKGSIRLSPDVSVTPFFCYPIIAEQPKPMQILPHTNNALVVLKEVASDRWYVSLCPLQFLPIAVRGTLVDKWNCITDGWEDLSCGDEVTKVDRNGLQLNLLSGSFKNRTCDDVMMAALNNGAISERLSTKRKEWRVSSLPFGKGRELPHTCIIEMMPWGQSHSMVLTLPKSRQSAEELSKKILQLAQSAKHLKCSIFSSFGTTLDKLGEYAREPSHISVYDKYLNLALCGTPLKSNRFGALVPCRNQKGKYSAKACSCDINYGNCIADVKDRLRRIDPRKNDKSGCKNEQLQCH